MQLNTTDSLLKYRNINILYEVFCHKVNYINYFIFLTFPIYNDS